MSHHAVVTVNSDGWTCNAACLITVVYLDLVTYRVSNWVKLVSKYVRLESRLGSHTLFGSHETVRFPSNAPLHADWWVTCISGTDSRSQYSSMKWFRIRSSYQVTKIESSACNGCTTEVHLKWPHSTFDCVLFCVNPHNIIFEPHCSVLMSTQIKAR